MARTIRTVIFDLDGVLVNACEWHYQALNTALTRITGDHIHRDEHIRIFNGLPTKVKLRMLMEAGRVRMDQIDEIANLKQEVTKETIQSLASYDAVKVEMHQWIKMEGLESGCVTNSIRATTELMLRCTGQREWLQAVFTNEDVVVAKPDPEGYNKAIHALGYLASETLLVEDSPRGKAAAYATGAHVWEVEDANQVTLENLQRAIVACE